MPNLSLAAAVNAYLIRHLGSQYTAAQVTVYHHGQRVLSQSVSKSITPEPHGKNKSPSPLIEANGVSQPSKSPSPHFSEGEGDLGGEGHPHHFDLASLTKLFTTTAALQAISAGKITLQTPVADIIPEFAASGGRVVVDDGMNPHTYAIEPPNPAFAGQTIDPAKITLWHLLTHTSGLAPWRKLYEDDAPPPPPTQPDPIPRHERWARGLQMICESPFIAPAGHAVRYSDLGFMLLGEIISRLQTTDVRILSRLSQDLIAQLFPDTPLSVGYIPALITSNASLFFAPTEYDARWRKRRIHGEVHDENACGVGGVAGHAGLFGTADALAGFGAMWCAHTLPNIAPELSQEAIRLHAETDGERRGLGWMLRSLGKSTAGTKFSVNSYGHTGFVGNMLWIDPDQDLVICCLTNNVYYGRGKTGLFEFRAGLNDLIWEALCAS